MPIKHQSYLLWKVHTLIFRPVLLVIPSSQSHQCVECFQHKQLLKNFALMKYTSAQLIYHFSNLCFLVWLDSGLLVTFVADQITPQRPFRAAVLNLV